MDPLLEPPPDFNISPPTKAVMAASWFRVHRSIHAAIHFDRSTDGRFNAPDSSYGVLYIAQAPEGAFAETALRTRTRPLRLTERFLHERALSSVDSGQMLLVDFSGLGLTRLGLDGRISVDDCYPLAQRWSKWVHDHPFGFDGVYYPARQAPSVCSAGLFDRAASKISATTLSAPSLLPKPGKASPALATLIRSFSFDILPDTW